MHSWDYCQCFTAIIVAFKRQGYNNAHEKCPFLHSSDVDSFEGNDGADVSVWDNVVPLKVRNDLHKEASSSGLGHRVFRRGKHTNTIERALDGILEELTGDGTQEEQYVEYWARQEWRHIEAHADVDEHLARSQDAAGHLEHAFQYPTRGHVLYLQVGTEVKGPTCLFPNRSSGGDLLSPVKSNNMDTGGGSAAAAEVELVTVPAVPGRLLRFHGNILHAVPRPTDLWLLLFVKGTQEFEPEETWGRSVILFNTWPASPQDIHTEERQHRESNMLEGEISRDYSMCHSRHTWQPLDVAIPPTEVSKEETKHTESTKIWLLGNERRRNHMMRTIKLLAPEEIRSALAEESAVRRLQLKQP